jgi:hypothetical protein
VLRDRYRAGQPCDPEKLAQAEKIVKATRAKVSAGEQAQEQPEAAGDAGAQPQEQANAVEYPEYIPIPGSPAWHAYKALKELPGEKMTRWELAPIMGCEGKAVDGSLATGIKRGAFLRGWTANHEAAWELGPNPNIVIQPLAAAAPPQFDAVAAPAPHKPRAADPPARVEPIAPARSALAQALDDLRAEEVATCNELVGIQVRLTDLQAGIAAIERLVAREQAAA